MASEIEQPTELEKLVVARRKELALERATKSGPGTQDLTTEEQMLAAATLALQQDRLSKHRKAPLAPWWEPILHPLALIITAASIVIPAGAYFSGFITDPLLYLRTFGISAAAVAVLAGWARLAAHNGNNALDGFGKMLGLSAAILAFASALALGAVGG